MEENLVQTQRPDFLYSDAGEYWISTYMEKISFARYRVQSQLKTAYVRQKDAASEVKICTGIVLLMLFIYWLLMELQASRDVAGFVIGTVLFAFFQFVMLIGFPICIYKIIRGLILIEIDRQGALGKVLTELCRWDVYAHEVQACEEYIRKCNAVYQDMEDWKKELEEGRSVDLDVVRERFEQIELDPKIQVVQTSGGRMHKIAATCALMLDVCLLIQFVLANF
ncbi:MAG: hypothetical protein IJ711_08010 [Lachnospiraceae bacterium]|nr:hypothetical protein [Lachnospiraceae bacterium]